ncbi:NAD(P)H-binding protein [Flammeovirga pacifica]|uniref:NAD(P)H-binding protein n=1 Tax=Flammeovirga pacifica TaxID=915059 RepID=UPI0006936431|nr:NAD(P)H-binding protein [Flammeovirga pacifica]
MEENYRVVFLGATGAVGTQALKQLFQLNNVTRILSLGRRPVELENTPSHLEQVKIDIHQPESYKEDIKDCDIAICTLGVGEATKVSKEEFIAIDKTAVVNFAKNCREKGVKHFHLLASIGIDSKSMNYYMRAKGELVDELVKLNFDSVSVYQPSMIMTPQNRYGIV